MSDTKDDKSSSAALYSPTEELNPLGHEIISRKIELSVPDNLNWPSNKSAINYCLIFVDTRGNSIDGGSGRLERIADAVKVLLECIGEDVNREGLQRTPERYAKALLFFTKGYTENLEGKLDLLMSGDGE
jgi:hypothetical protein